MKGHHLVTLVLVAALVVLSYRHHQSTGKWV